MRDNNVIVLTTMPDFNNPLLKIIYSSGFVWIISEENLLNCIEILFLRYILREKTAKISPTSFGEPILKALD